MSGNKGFLASIRNCDTWRRPRPAGTPPRPAGTWPGGAGTPPGWTGMRAGKPSGSFLARSGWFLDGSGRFLARSPLRLDRSGWFLAGAGCRLAASGWFLAGSGRFLDRSEPRLARKGGGTLNSEQLNFERGRHERRTPPRSKFRVQGSKFKVPRPHSCPFVSIRGFRFPAFPLSAFQPFRFSAF
jgi:hypothetical protein